MSEMSAGWESLDPEKNLITEIDPSLRAAFRAAWHGQRDVFGYTLFAEMTPAAGHILMDLPEPELGGLRFLIVDEYQDLNRADIRMIEALASHGVSVLAVGDDDQSIYGFRQAAPQGIREFATSPSFPDARSYTLSISHRLGSAILDAARELIESSPTRQPKPPLLAAAGNAPGEVRYLRFANNKAEVAAVARMVKNLVEQRGVTPDQVLVLMRSDFNHAWSGPLRDALGDCGIPVADVESALEPLSTDNARRLIALARVMDGEDDLSWWTLLHLTKGIAEILSTAVANSALHEGTRFSQRLSRLDAEPLPPDSGVTVQSASRACALAREVRDLRDRASRLAPPDADAGETWADWILRFAEEAGAEVEPELNGLLLAAGAREPVDEGLQHFLDSLDRAARDIALEEPAVALMTISRSKGLTRDAAFIVGVESGLVPRADSNTEEERRLLYVAMTRARSYLFLTMANRRTGPTARSGGGDSTDVRRRSRFFTDSALQPVAGGPYLQHFVSTLVSTPPGT